MRLLYAAFPGRSIAKAALPGGIAGAVCGFDGLGNYAPVSNALCMPCLFSSNEDAMAKIWGDTSVHDALDEAFAEINMQIVGYVNRPFRVVCNNVRSVGSPADMKGLVPGILMGLLQVVIRWFTAKKRGGVDASRVLIVSADTSIIEDIYRLSGPGYAPAGAGGVRQTRRGKRGEIHMRAHLRSDAEAIISASLKAVLPDRAVQQALKRYVPGAGRTLLVAVGKAAWQMAQAAAGALGHVDGGVVITKYGHVNGEIPGVACYEAGHPVPDENGFAATAAALKLTEGLTAADTVLFLLSGGGSALFERPLVSGRELQDITGQLLASGADIVEMNTIRKRLSGVKGGRFALACAPAQVFSVVLSDILGDPLDMIASGPACADSATCEQAQAIAAKYQLKLSAEAKALMEIETPKKLDNVTTQITGSVRELCAAAAKECRALGYTPVLLTDHLDCEAREAGRFLADILRSHAEDGQALAFIAGGETVVHLTGNGMGGRNQELALAAAPGIGGIPGAAVFSVGSDGTDGPTDAAGGYVDGDTLAALRAKDLDIHQVLQDNDAYHALKAVNGLIFTGPTGTNVNDVAVALMRA